MSKYIKLEDAEDKMYQLWEEDTDSKINSAYCFDDDRAIEALRSLPTIEVSEDCISREWLKGRIEKVSYENEWHMTETDDFVSWENIKNAPSVVPTQTNADQRVERIEYVGDIKKKRCRMCEHLVSEFHTPISSEGTYYTYVICTAKECHCESDYGAKMKG